MDESENSESLLWTGFWILEVSSQSLISDFNSLNLKNRCSDSLITGVVSLRTETGSINSVAS